jgi:hypothetical protein
MCSQRGWYHGARRPAAIRLVPSRDAVSRQPGGNRHGPPVTDPLRDLEHALATGNAIGWLLRHAPDGDADAALARAWAVTTYCVGMRVLAAIRKQRRLPLKWFCGADGICPRWRSETCPDCADAIRRDVPTPPLTWAEMTSRGGAAGERR